jgi:hypothetical protein
MQRFHPIPAFKVPCAVALTAMSGRSVLATKHEAG